MASSNNKNAAIGCFVLAVAFASVAVKNTFFSEGMSVTDASGLGVSRMVGAFLPAIIAGAVGAWLLQKPSS